MKRVVAIAAALLLPAALALPVAAQSSQDPPKAPSHAPVRPVPVVVHQPLVLSIEPPASSGFTPAPVPNLDIAAPAAAPKVGPEFSGTLFAPHDTSASANGYTSGSQYSTDLERRSRQGIGNGFAPTLSLKIPFTYANSLP